MTQNRKNKSAIRPDYAVGFPKKKKPMPDAADPRPEIRFNAKKPHPGRCGFS